MEKTTRHTLLIACDDAKGLISKITGTLFFHGLNIVRNAEFVDPEKARFFMRTVVEGDCVGDDVIKALEALLPAGAVVRFAEKKPKKIVLMGTREAHALGDLLVRCYDGELNAHIQAVISNHEVLKKLTSSFGFPFHYISHDNCDRNEHEQQILNVLEKYNPDYVVLAKYMRILSPEFVARFPQRIINIHHSFLPAFIGANPYRQAYKRGVKIIGATAHFVTDDLDEGPIIAQDVNKVSHHLTPKQLARSGKDIEKIVLARALNLVLEDRVFVNGNKTILFE